MNLQERLALRADLRRVQYFTTPASSPRFKPSNVLFTRRGVPKIADFSLYGSSFLMEMLMGSVAEQITPMFVAPEFIRKEKPTPACDQYSLGITMYMMFAERIPFQVDSLPKLYQCHLRVVPEHPSVVNPKCPRALGDVIMRLIKKEPKERFRDCDEVRIMIADLGRSRL